MTAGAAVGAEEDDHAEEGPGAEDRDLTEAQPEQEAAPVARAEVVADVPCSCGAPFLLRGGGAGTGCSRWRAPASAACGLPPGSAGKAASGAGVGPASGAGRLAPASRRCAGGAPPDPGPPAGWPPVPASFSWSGPDSHPDHRPLPGSERRRNPCSARRRRPPPRTVPPDATAAPTRAPVRTAAAPARLPKPDAPPTMPATAVASRMGRRRKTAKGAMAASRKMSAAATRAPKFRRGHRLRPSASAPRTRTKAMTNLLMQSTKRVSAPRFRAWWAPGHSEARAMRGMKAATM